MTYRYRSDVAAGLLRHGLRPTSATPPARAREALSDLYRYEIRRLRDRFRRGEVPQSAYVDRVIALRRRYALLSLPVHLWAQPANPEAIPPVAKGPSDRSGRLIRVRLGSFDPAVHLRVLDVWLRRPHVLVWWRAAEAALSRAGSGQQQQALIVADESPVGYLRWQPVSRNDLDAVGLADIPDAAVDIDVLIGEPEFVGRGIAAEALKLLLDLLRQRFDVQFAGMSTAAANHAAIRAYTKAGFQKTHEYHDPQFGPCWIMMIRLRPAHSPR